MFEILGRNCDPSYINIPPYNIYEKINIKIKLRLNYTFSSSSFIGSIVLYVHNIAWKVSAFKRFPIALMKLGNFCWTTVAALSEISFCTFYSQKCTKKNLTEEFDN